MLPRAVTPVDASARITGKNRWAPDITALTATFSTVYSQIFSEMGRAHVADHFVGLYRRVGEHFLDALFRRQDDGSLAGRIFVEK